MGGCASRPKDLNSAPATLPGENSVSEPIIKDVQVETSQEIKKGEETKTEEPLVDLSEPTKDLKSEKEVSAESKTELSDLVTEINAPSDEKKTEKKVEEGNEPTEKVKEEPVAEAKVLVEEIPKSDDELLNSAPEKKDEVPIVTL